MSYAFSLTGTNRAEPRAAINPFTGGSEMLPTFAMNADERAAVQAVVRRHGGTFEAGEGDLVVAGARMHFEDFGGLRCAVSIEGAIESAIAVLFELAAAGRLVVLNEHESCDEPIPVVTTAEARAQAIASDVEDGDVELATDVGRFLRVLLPGYDRVRGNGGA
ncbi:MAG: hypothetical protein U0169_05290 [Polyangiaceae bacterium]